MATAQTSKRRYVKWSLIFLITCAALLVIDHFRGRSKLAAARANLKARGYPAEFRELLPIPPPNIKVWIKEFNAAVSNRFSTPFYGGGSIIDLGNGFAAVGSKAPHPAGTSGGSVVFTNSLAVQTPGTNRWETLDRGLAEHATALKIIRRLLDEPVPNFGFDYISAARDLKIPNFISFRTAAQHLADAAVIHLHAENLAEAELDIIALAGCVRMNHADPTLIGQMIRVAIEGMGEGAIWDALQHDGWTDQQLARMQKAWQIDPTPPKVVAALHTERLNRVELYESFRAHSYLAWQTKNHAIMSGFGAKILLPPRVVQLGNQYIFKPLWDFAWADLEEALWLQSSDYLTEPYQAAVKRHSLANVPAFYQPQHHFAPFRFYFQVPIAEKFSEIIGPPAANAALPQEHSLLSYLVIPGRTDFIPVKYDLAVEISARNDNLRQMSLIAFALKRYHLQNHAYPANLDALVPTFLAEVPLDWFDANPIRYRLNANGTFTMYSVGADGYDGNADSTPRTPNYPRYNRDDVWRTPVNWAGK